MSTKLAAAVAMAVALLATPAAAQDIRGQVPLPASDRSSEPPALSADQVDTVAAGLRGRFAREVGGIPAPSDPMAWAQHVQQVMASAGVGIEAPMLVVTVDRNPTVQELHVVLVRPGGGDWEFIGGTRVSTGKPGRREHFKTPVGAFRNSSDILGYRAEGTYNENHVRGLGLKGMRVWDFGWQRTEDWRHPGAKSEIRLEMHATDPSVLEPRIGRPDSEGCVRIPAALDRFLDHHGVIDADYEAAAASDRRFAALLPRDREPSRLAGSILVVFDSSRG